MSIKPILFSTPMVRAILDGRKTMTRRVIRYTDGLRDWDVPKRKPTYQPGDILWVRETWSVRYAKNTLTPDGYNYKASMPNTTNWRPSIFMPKDAARIFLRVTDVRCERLWKISQEDCQREGCSGAECDCLRLGRGWMGCESCMNSGWQEPPIVEFMQLWESLNAKRGYGWDMNPWVFVYTFEPTDKPEGWPI